MNNNTFSTAVQLSAAASKHKSLPTSMAEVASAKTDNGALTHASSGTAVVDLFSMIGSSRNSPEGAVKQFKLAFAQNPRLAAQILCWARDFRGSGAGERNTFRAIIVAMENEPNFLPYLARMLPYIPEYGRWDDLLVFKNLAIQESAFALIKNALWNENGLCAKWMPRQIEKNMTVDQKNMIYRLRGHLGLSPKSYRKLLVRLSKTVEQQMCSGKWEEINYSQVPSVASARYQKAFGRHDKDGYTSYITELMKPVAERKDPKIKINASAIFPYTIIQNLRTGNKNAAQAQWDALPNYMEGNGVRALPIVDTSHSMDRVVSGISMCDIATSIGLYIADKQAGAFKDLAFTFENVPKAVSLSGTLNNKYAQILDQRKAENTNLQRCFELLLKIARENNVPQSDMPEVLLVLSDMEFDSCSTGDRHFWDSGKIVEQKPITNFEGIARKYTDAGYVLPRIVFWKIDGSANSKNPVTFRQDGTALVSGFNTAILKSILSLNLQEFTPESIMIEAIDQDRYRIFEGLAE